MKYKDEEVGLLSLTAELLLSHLHVLLQLTDRIFQGCPGVIDLVHNEDVLANKIGHLERAEVEPLSPGHLGSGNLFGVTTSQVLIERQADSLNGNVGLAGTLEERASRRT